MNRTGAAAAILLLSTGAALAGRQEPPNKTDIYNFQNGADGTEPRGDLLVAADGALYGTASLGGTDSNGTVYKLVPPVGKTPAALTTLWQFTGGDDGSFPAAALIGDPTQALYGTAEFDGAGGHGTVFQLTPPPSGSAWSEQTLWHFSGGADGGNPTGALLQSAGALYGTTGLGGSANHGVVFQLTPPPSGSGPWTENVIWQFTGGADGASPVAALIADAQGRLYGTTKAGGPDNVGTVFRLNPPSGSGAWTLDVLWGFTGGVDGAAPEGTLAFDGNGILFGTTLMGAGVDCPQPLWPYYGDSHTRTDPANGADYIPAGGNGCGVVFALAPPGGGGTPWQQTVLYTFTGSHGIDGGNPAGAVLLHPNGAIYGVSTDFSTTWWGSIFKLTPPANGQGAWTETVQSTYNGHYGGFYPNAGLVLGLDGLLYSTTTVGGSTWEHVKDYGLGTVVQSPP